ncbi:MAG: non-homologous end-joining DNA ligase [Fimbriimonadaceae bacterium]
MSREKQLPEVRLTSPGRVIDEESGSTKQDLFDYYAFIAPWLMPFLQDRVCTLVRYPEGLSGEGFFQKHMLHGRYSGIQPARVDGENYLAITEPDGLLQACQMGTIEFHPWGSTLQDLERPDMIVFDLDPGEGTEWKEVVQGAQYLRERLETLGLKPFVRLTGGKGLHLVLRILPELEWPEVKQICRTLAEQMEKEKPDRFVTNMRKSSRKDRIFLDYLRNSRGATAVASYSARARPRLTVAMPVSWDQLPEIKTSSPFDIQNVAAYLEERATDPWAEFTGSAVSLKGALKLG